MFSVYNIQPDYCEIYSGDYREFPAEGEVDAYGYVHIENVVAWADFENDELHEVERWFPFNDFNYDRYCLNGFCKIGHYNTGYATMDEAIAALIEYWNDTIPNCHYDPVVDRHDF